ncbi:uncharacterized protein LOC133178469 [Saccostrea echinata]|uniref:uncharacterized protein LOC133178469 n=1 Tax=Saccostrea echinata TaxID=191078 RepID=UPI002A8338FC|nr:uncharacterized protein LOC133178469 [Saccostrea echinata]
MEFKVTEPLKERNKTRKANKHEEDEASNSDSDSDTPSCSKAKKLPPSSHSYDTTSSNDEENTDSCESNEDGNYSASKCTFADLQLLNIFYEKTPESMENFMREVKNAFMERKGFCPNCSMMNNVLKEHLKNLTFSYDLTNLRDLRVYGNPGVVADRVTKEIEKYLQWTWKKSQEMLQKNQFYQTLDTSMQEKAQELIFSLSFPVKTFAGETIQLVKKILFGKLEEKWRSSDEMERGKGRKRSERARVRCRRSHGQHADSKISYKATTENFFQQYCEKFAGLFFLVKGEVLEGSFSFKNQMLKSTPDVVYQYLSDSGYPQDQLLFVTEANSAVASEEGTTYMEQVVGQNVMGQVGAELLGQSPHSVFYPFSLGVVCMETKLIFVLLKIAEEHSVSIQKGESGSAENPGKIIYTEPFDMLKQEDRLKMAEFLYWLGFVQDLKKYDFL